MYGQSPGLDSSMSEQPLGINWGINEPNYLRQMCECLICSELSPLNSGWPCTFVLIKLCIVLLLNGLKISSGIVIV